MLKKVRNHPTRIISISPNIKYPAARANPIIKKRGTEAIAVVADQTLNSNASPGTNAAPKNIVPMTYMKRLKNSCPMVIRIQFIALLSSD